jgi:hypothetical protein
MCVFSPGLVIILQKLGLQALSSQPEELSFDDWREQLSKRVEG